MRHLTQNNLIVFPIIDISVGNKVLSYYFIKKVILTLANFLPHTPTHIYIYIYIEREREGERERKKAR